MAGKRHDQAIFEVARKIGLPEAREAYLRQICGEDVALEHRITALLWAHDESTTFLESPPPGLDALLTDNPFLLECPGTQIGPYKLLQQIGEGGMGTVFMAEQSEPVRRKVAIKVIKAGMDSRQVIARFEAERQALAMMDHVNIARVLDAGSTAQCRPYFVMELVYGVPITTYCDEHQLTPRQRLELFVPVCHAIQHAHQKGIIHRDVKPTNVMITLCDGDPVPKVIDFGVAKATGQRLTERTLFTQCGTMVGTLEYMSPEQAETGVLGVDTRSDIYSLGVLLYELLTGSTPLGSKRMKESTYSDILRMIREEEPPKPSTRLSESGEALVSISALRHMEPSRLTKLMRGELDWIVMKTLEKDRNRRYATANGLAADLQRYLNDEHVQACPPSAVYRLGKFVRRNKAGFFAASLITLFLCLTVINLAVSNTRIRREQARTEVEKVRAVKAEVRAQNRADEIQRGLERLKAANTLLDRGRWYIGERRWDDARAAYTTAIELRPDHVSAWVERGNLYAHLGLWDAAAIDFAQEIALREPDTTLRWYQHALLRLYVGDRKGYDQACQRIEERFRGSGRAIFIEEMVRSNVLASRPDRDITSFVKLSQAVVDKQPWSSYSLYVLGTAHFRAGQYQLAVERLQQSLTATDWTNRLLSYPVLAMAYHQLGRVDESRAALDEALRVLDQWTQGRYPLPDEYWVMHQGAEANWPIIWWDWLECQMFCREAKLLIDGELLPDDPRLHVLRARSLAGLHSNNQASREYAKALKLWPLDEQIQVEAHRNRGYCFVGSRDWTEAAVEFTKASELRPQDAYLWRFRAIACLVAGDEPAYRRCCAEMLDRFSLSEDERTAGNVLLACVLTGDALPEMAQLLPLTRSTHQLGYWGSYVRGAAMYRAGQYDEALACFERAEDIYEPSAWDWSFRAMINHRLERDEQATICLVNAANWIDQAERRDDDLNPRGEDDLSGKQPAWGNWYEPMIYRRLLREAEDLLKT